MKYLIIILTLLTLTCCAPRSMTQRTSYEIGCAPEETDIIAFINNMDHPWVVECESRGIFMCYRNPEHGQVRCDELK